MTGPAERTGCGGPTGWKRARCDAVALGRRLALREPGDLRRGAIVLASAATLTAARREIHEEVVRHRSASRSRLYDDARTLSKGWVSPLLAGSFYVAGRAGGNPYHRETAQVLLESTVASALLATTGSFVLAVERPREGTSVRAFDTDGRGVSLDVALAASVVAPIDRRYLRARRGDRRAVRAARAAGRGVLYAGLALTAMQRMDSDSHWAPDVFLGAAAGLTAGYALCAAHEQPDAPPAAPRAGRPAVSLGPGVAALRWTF